MHVDLTPNAHFAWDVDAWLHRKPNSANEQAVIPSLEVVQVRSAAMKLDVHGVASPMHEEITEVPFRDERAADVVDLVAAYLPALFVAGVQEIDAGLTRPTNRLPDRL